MRAARLHMWTLAALATAACAPAPGGIGPAAEPPARDPASAWLVLERMQDPPLGRRMARVHLNDRALTALAAGERRQVAVPPGRHRVAVDLWDQPGHCEVEVDLAPGQALALQVSPLTASPRPGPRCEGGFRIAVGGAEGRTAAHAHRRAPPEPRVAGPAMVSVR